LEHWLYKQALSLHVHVIRFITGNVGLTHGKQKQGAKLDMLNLLILLIFSLNA